MKITLKTPLQSISGSYSKSVINKLRYDIFTKNLNKLHTEIKLTSGNNQTEKHLEKLLSNFLNEVFYKDNFYINSKSYKGLNECDLVIYNGKSFDSEGGVLIEIKKPSNPEMITKDNFLQKSLYESVLYYLWEKVYHKNNEIHNIIITNFDNWFIIDSKEFHKNFNKSKLTNFFEKWRIGSTDSNKTEQMYSFIENYIKSNDIEITSTFFNLNESVELIDSDTEESKNKLISLYKILSPRHLLDIKDEKDNNSLNKDFYNELLYIIGLKEEKVKGKIILELNNQNGTLIENTISIIKSEGLIDNLDNKQHYGKETNEQLFNISLELCITWINRIIFLKLLENQLLNYHNSNNDYTFIGSDKIDTFQNLNQLFFEVLSERVESRDSNIKNRLNKIINIDYIPYLNSSLFEPTLLEKKTLRISGLDDNSKLKVFQKSNLTKNENSLRGSELLTIKYLLKFLESYDFGSIKKVKLSTSEKTIISSSVLGSIFEKINGYKDGSVFTPSFITTEMCKTTLEKTILKKFNSQFNWECENYIDLINHFEKKNIIIYNQIINDLKILDPSVGSGHYLVSMLNEIILTKFKLGILCDEENRIIKDDDVSIIIENDELIIRDYQGDIFNYSVNINGSIIPSIQRIQETIFKEKKNLIEGCLFGVDINPNSVQICRLRLWIELLKSSYYTKESQFKELKTLPNIDINIKQGNSLIHKFNFDDNLSNLFNGKFKVKDYQEKVKQYKDTNDKQIKRELNNYLIELKQEFKKGVSESIKTDINKSSSKYNDYKVKLENIVLFGEKISKQEKEKLKELLEEYNDKKKKVDEIGNNIFYNDSFEWRFEFPELLDVKGEFVGFDIIIGNPPYVVISKDNFLSKLYKWNTDLYLMFFELSLKKLLKDGGLLSFITPRFYLVNQNCLDIRKTLVDEYSTYTLIETNPFEEVNTECVITYIEKTKSYKETIPIFSEKNKKFIKINDLEKDLIRKRNEYTIISFLTREIDEVLDHIETKTNNISDITLESLRGLEIGKKDLISDDGVECLIGGDTNRYRIDYNSTYVQSNNKEYKRLENFFRKDNMVLLRRVSKDLKSTINDKRYSFNKNLYGIVLNNNYSNYFIVGLLNSELLNFYYKFKFSTKKEDLFPEVQKYLYEQLPIKETNLEQQQEIIEIVKQLQLSPNDGTLIKELNQKVYSLYEIDEVQLKIIQNLI